MNAIDGEFQRNFFNNVGPSYEGAFENNNPYFYFIFRNLLSALNMPPGKKVLEMGSSFGRFTIPLIEHGYLITAVDFSSKLLEELDKKLHKRHLNSRATLIENDVCKLNKVESGSYDAVCGAHILHHVSNTAETISCAYAALKIGGRAVFMEPNPFNLQHYANMLAKPATRGWEVERGILNVRAGRIKRQFFQAGFSDCRVYSFGFFPPFVINGFPDFTRMESILKRMRCLGWLATLNLFVADKK